MKVTHFRDVPGQSVEMAGARGVIARVPISAEDGGPFTMRVFSVVPGGTTPYHRHDYEHEIFILNGKGRLLYPGGSRQVRSGDTVLVEVNDWHGFKADEEMGMEFICLVPNRAYIPDQCVVEPGAWDGDEPKMSY